MEFYILALFVVSSTVLNVDSKPGPPDVCILPADKGPCEGAFYRYFYNTFTHDCEPFTYGGCGGNGNNFNTYKDCWGMCSRKPRIPYTCTLPRDDKSCVNTHSRYFFNMTTLQCEKFFCGGCPLTKNCFLNLDSCAKRCNPQEHACLLPLKRGPPCPLMTKRWFYNITTQNCEPFSYSGQDGNYNNFPSFEECWKACFRLPRVPPICRFPKDPGPCKAALKRYFFNITSMQCQPFVYGGCLGNANRFPDIECCWDHCRPQDPTPPPCDDHGM